MQLFPSIYLTLVPFKFLLQHRNCIAWIIKIIINILWYVFLHIEEMFSVVSLVNDLDLDMFDDP